eukprot:1707698-Heterocapsa_arctica.AAC.1
MFEQPSKAFNTTPEDRSQTFKQLQHLQTTARRPVTISLKHQQQKPSKPCAPVCVHLWGALVIV